MNPLRLALATTAAASFALAQTAPTYTFFGQPCAGTAGAPTSTSTGLPAYGYVMTFDLEGAPANTIAVLALGTSNSQYAGLPLPLDLGSIGAPGCSLYVSADATVTWPTDNNGYSSYAFFFPAGVSGFEFFTQWAVLDLAANNFGFVLSDAGAVVVGDQIYGVNLIANPGAEEDIGQPAGEDVDLQRWRDDSGFMTAQLYNGFSVDDPTTGGVNPGPAFGNNYFYGGENWGSQYQSIFQEIALHQIATDIDAQKAQYDMAGAFGGWSGQDDVMTLYATFVDDVGAVLGAVQIGGAVSNAAARGGQSGYVNDMLQGILPIGTRRVLLELECYKIPGGSYADGAADNLEFVLTLLP